LSKNNIIWSRLEERAPSGFGFVLDYRYDGISTGTFFFVQRSQQTWAAAAQAGVFADEISPVLLKSKKVGHCIHRGCDRIALNF